MVELVKMSKLYSTGMISWGYDIVRNNFFLEHLNKHVCKLYSSNAYMHKCSSINKTDIIKVRVIGILKMHCNINSNLHNEYLIQIMLTQHVWPHTNQRNRKTKNKYFRHFLFGHSLQTPVALLMGSNEKLIKSLQNF